MVIPQMAERNDGAVIFISSISRLKGNARIGAYELSQTADMQLSRNLAIEWGSDNIRVNCIAPGVVKKTGFARTLWEDAEANKITVAAYPLGR